MNKYLDYEGVSHLWEKIKDRIDSKKELPDDGEPGYVLKKTETGVQWSDESINEANVLIIDPDEVIDDLDITYLTTSQQNLSEDEKIQVRENLGIDLDALPDNSPSFLTITVVGPQSGFLIQVIDENGNILNEQTTITKTHFIQADTKYYISAYDVGNYIAPENTELYTAIAWKEKSLEIVYTYHAGTKTPTNGVYIQDTDGYCHTESEWTGEYNANGVAVVTDNCSFVIAMANIGTAAWGTSASISGITETTSSATALTDYDGEAQTDIIVSALGTAVSNYAAPKCKQYKFPNGTTGYLGAAGEWNAAYSNKRAVTSAMSKCGGTALTAGNYWTSTGRNSTTAYTYSWSSGSAASATKSNSSAKYVRAFASL